MKWQATTRDRYDGRHPAVQLPASVCWEEKNPNRLYWPSMFIQARNCLFFSIGLTVLTQDRHTTTKQDCKKQLDIEYAKEHRARMPVEVQWMLGDNRSIAREFSLTLRYSSESWPVDRSCCYVWLFWHTVLCIARQRGGV